MSFGFWFSRQHIKMQRYYFANKGPYSQSYSFSSSQVWMWELDRALKNWCFWIAVLERRLLRVPWTARRSNQSILKEISPKKFVGKTDAEAETPILWPPVVKNWLIWKDFDAGKHWGQEEKGTTEDETVGMASLTQWTWVWVNSRGWWWTGRPGVLQSIGLQRVGHDWVTELNWSEIL